MNTETVFVLFKPDCVRRGLVGVFQEEIAAAGLTITKSQKLILTRAQVETIYRDIKSEHFYADLIGFIMNGLCAVHVVVGQRAISVMQKLKNNLRKRYCLTEHCLQGDEFCLWENNRHPCQSFYNVKICAENLLHVCDTEVESLRCIAAVF